MDDEEARGEAPLHTSQSSEARLGRLTGAVALEQLSFLSFGRIGAGAREPRLDEDFLPGSGSVASQLQAFVASALRKEREGTGTHFCGWCQQDQDEEPRATPPGTAGLARLSLLDVIDLTVGVRTLHDHGTHFCHQSHQLWRETGEC